MCYVLFLKSHITVGSHKKLADSIEELYLEPTTKLTKDALNPYILGKRYRMCLSSVIRHLKSAIFPLTLLVDCNGNL
jgi:hypothetical protein